MVANSKSAFEQYHALVVLSEMPEQLEPDHARQLRETVQDQMSGGEGKWIKKGTNRWEVATALLHKLR